jgi:hypothetical protein
VRRVLIVSPRFPPTNAADIHRVRQSLPYLAEFGWEAVVLAVEPEFCDAPTDPLLLDTIPAATSVVRTEAVSPRLTRYFGISSLDLRAHMHLKAAGVKLLELGQFDLIYFSTTAFGIMSLGPQWAQRFGLPFVLDLQDPWVSEYHDDPNAGPPPGGRLKYAIMQALARRQERKTMAHAKHIISVSAAYPQILTRRYDFLNDNQFTILPFGAPEIDLELVKRAGIRQQVFERNDGNQHWVYIGRAGHDMALALSAFFKALARARCQYPAFYDNVRLHFVGTTYAQGSRAVASVAPIAESYGVGDLVEERPHRISYFETLQCLIEADALIVPGSDDPSYTASKLYPYILAKRPLLAIFHERSSVVDVLQKTGAGIVVPFASGVSTEALSDMIYEAWFQGGGAPPMPATNWQAFSRYTAREMTRRQCQVFDSAVK